MKNILFTFLILCFVKLASGQGVDILLSSNSSSFTVSYNFNEDYNSGERLKWNSQQVMIKYPKEIGNLNLSLTDDQACFQWSSFNAGEIGEFIYYVFADFDGATNCSFSQNDNVIMFTVDVSAPEISGQKQSSYRNTNIDFSIVSTAEAGALGFGEPSINNAGTGENEINSASGTATVVLPINLKSFSADKHSETSSILNWESLSEINASHYIVERSVDTKDWTAIGKVATTGSETEGAAYSYVDSELPIQSRNLEQIFYYRLRMVDLDGSYEFSHTEAVRFDMILLEGLHILPNPTAQDIYISIDKVKEGTELLLLDNTGKVVLKHSLTDGRDERVSLNSLSAGTYFAKVIRDNELLTQKLIKID